MTSTRRMVAGLLAALLGVALALAVAPPARADSNTDEAQFFADLNVVRAQHGVPPVATDGQLISVARAWSAQMASAGALSHNPNLANQVSNWKFLGENVGTGSDEPSVEAAFVASPHHFENMVDPNYQYVGVGEVVSGGVLWVTVDFKGAKTGTLPSTQIPQSAPKPSPPKPATAPARPTAPATHTAVAHTSAAPPAAAAGAGAPSALATLASATTPAPSTSPPSGSEPASSHKTKANALAAGLAVVASTPVLDGARFASLILFAVLAGAAVLAVYGHLPGCPRLRRAE